MSTSDAVKAAVAEVDAATAPQPVATRIGPAEQAVIKARESADDRIPAHLPVDLTIRTVAKVVFGRNRDFEATDNSPVRVTLHLPYIGQDNVTFQTLRNQLKAFAFRNQPGLVEVLSTLESGDYVYLIGDITQNSSPKSGDEKGFNNWPAEIHLRDVTKVSEEFAKNSTRFSIA